MTITEQIEADLRARIVSDETLPFQLTLGAMAGYYEVSLMPVRNAVETLIDERFLQRGRNGRLSIHPKHPEQADVPPEAMSHRAQTSPEKRLADYIIDLSLKGTMESLREEVTAEQFSIGRTVLRRILNRFAGEGIIEHLPRRGWRVRPFQEKDMLDYIAMREQLELFALDLAYPAMKSEVLKELIAGNTPGEDGQPNMDNRLHRYWIELSGNRYLIEFFNQRGIYYEALFARAVLDSATVDQRAAEHRAILYGLLDDNLLLAKSALSAHIRDQRKHVNELFASLSANPQAE